MTATTAPATAIPAGDHTPATLYEQAVEAVAAVLDTVIPVGMFLLIVIGTPLMWLGLIG